MMTFSGLKYSATYLCLRGDGKGCLFILCVPQHTAGLLLIVAGRTSARLILFFISSHRHTRIRLVVSESYIFHGRQPQAQKSKAQCHQPGIQEIPESLSFITKIICEHKQMWSTNMPFNWGGRWSHRGRDSSEMGLLWNLGDYPTKIWMSEAALLHFSKNTEFQQLDEEKAWFLRQEVYFLTFLFFWRQQCNGNGNNSWAVRGRPLASWLNYLCN